MKRRTMEFRTIHFHYKIKQNVICFVMQLSVRIITSIFLFFFFDNRISYISI